MGSIMSRIADDEEEASWKRREEEVFHKMKCKLALDKLLDGTYEDPSEVNLAMQYVREMLAENSSLKEEVQSYRTTFKMLSSSMGLACKK